MPNPIQTITLMALTASVVAAPLGAHRSNRTVAPSTPVVTIVLKERFARPRDAAVLRRTPGTNTVNIIALKRSAATPELLATAFAILGKSREQEGETPVRKITVIIPDGLKHRPLSSADRARMTDVINRVLAADPQAVPGVGRVPAITVDLNP
jgi:hypothetical protein